MNYRRQYCTLKSRGMVSPWNFKSLFHLESKSLVLTKKRIVLGLISRTGTRRRSFNLFRIQHRLLLDCVELFHVVALQQLRILLFPLFESMDEINWSSLIDRNLDDLCRSEAVAGTEVQFDSILRSFFSRSADRIPLMVLLCCSLVFLRQRSLELLLSIVYC